MFFYTILQGHLLAWVVQHASIIAQKKPVRLFYIPQALQLKNKLSLIVDTPDSGFSNWDY